ncbi:myb-like protein D [Phymastichus coffea]|uniref:myb-like protein D n=1 Tax=Phymastichus coffea TaxID=108790 RepID=UPI00273C4D51|nr:myb-like protein D [Phymastichus coffea]
MIEEIKKKSLEELKAKSESPYEKYFEDWKKRSHNSVQNTNKILMQKALLAPGKLLQSANCIRMTYGDINYLGNNEALLYSDSGTQGTQTFTNSVYSLKFQPKHKDLIIVDDVVFTFTCNCTNIIQHQNNNSGFPFNVVLFDEETFHRNGSLNTDQDEEEQSSSEEGDNNDGDNNNNCIDNRINNNHNINTNSNTNNNSIDSNNSNFRNDSRGEQRTFRNGDGETPLPKSTVLKTLRRFLETGSIKNRSVTGRP